MRRRRHGWLLPLAMVLVAFGVAGIRSEHAQPNDWALIAIGLAGTSWYGLSWLRDRRDEP